MTIDELRAAFGQVEREVFRLEVQQSYAGVADPGWEAWQAGRPLPQRTVENNSWLAELVSHVAAGRRRYRVLVVDTPLTEYLRYELAAFADNVAAGEEIFVVLSEADPRLADLTEDFWMFDSGSWRSCGTTTSIGRSDRRSPPNRSRRTLPSGTWR